EVEDVDGSDPPVPPSLLVRSSLQSVAAHPSDQAQSAWIKTTIVRARCMGARSYSHGPAEGDSTPRPLLARGRGAGGDLGSAALQDAALAVGRERRAELADVAARRARVADGVALAVEQRRERGPARGAAVDDAAIEARLVGRPRGA